MNLIKNEKSKAKQNSKITYFPIPPRNVEGLKSPTLSESEKIAVRHTIGRWHKDASVVLLYISIYTQNNQSYTIQAPLET